jgi:cytochrome P450
MTASFDQQLLLAAKRLGRGKGRQGKLPGARIRRSISTSYYALFHFLIDEAGRRLLGANGNLLRRRRVFARVFTHRGMKTALDKVKGRTVEQSVEDFLRPPGVVSDTVAAPAFARNLADVFSDAQSKRHSADYDLNMPMSERDAKLLRTRVDRAIRNWRSANTVADRDFKHALCMLMLLKGRVRQDD